MFTINKMEVFTMVLNVYLPRGPEPSDLDDLIFSDDTWTPSDK